MGTLILASLIIGCSLSVGIADESEADSYYTEGGIKYLISGGVAKVIDYDGESTVAIPSSVVTIQNPSSAEV